MHAQSNEFTITTAGNCRRCRGPRARPRARHHLVWTPKHVLRAYERETAIHKNSGHSRRCRRPGGLELARPAQAEALPPFAAKKRKKKPPVDVNTSRSRQRRRRAQSSQVYSSCVLNWTLSSRKSIQRSSSRKGTGGAASLAKTQFSR